MDPLKERLKKQSGGLVLDVATGRGESALYLAGAFASFTKIIGVDMSKENLEIARKSIDGKNIELFRMKAEALAFDDNLFDSVAIFNSLHHLEFVQKTLQEMKRVLKPGGLFLVLEMIRDDLNEKQKTYMEWHHWRAALDRINGISHNETFSRQGILSLASSIGLSKWTYFEYNDDSEIDNKGIIDNLTETIDQSIAKIDGKPELKHFVDEGIRIKRSLNAIGFAWATQFIVLGKK
jgi:ubiquinone/menaquinone biosynthesis C-methylase UbiE